MKYGQLLKNTNMNTTAYRCFRYISPEDEMKFVNKFHKQHGYGWQITHTYRELVLGAYLCSKGFNARYEVDLDLKTPDWSIFDEGQEIIAIVELFSFHAPKEYENSFWKSLGAKGVSFGWKPKNINRLYSSIRDKTTTYKELIKKYKLALIVAIFDQKPADIQMKELQNCLLAEETGLFELYSELSGTLLFHEGFSDLFPAPYSFRYIENPRPLKEFLLT